MKLLSSNLPSTFSSAFPGWSPPHMPGMPGSSSAQPRSSWITNLRQAFLEAGGLLSPLLSQLPGEELERVTLRAREPQNCKGPEVGKMELRGSRRVRGCGWRSALGLESCAALLYPPTLFLHIIVILKWVKIYYTFFLLFKTLFQHNYAYRNTLILVNRMPFKLNLPYTIWTKDLVHGLSLKKKKLFAIWFISHLLQMYIKDPPIKCC